MPNKPLSKREKETGVRFIRYQGRIIPIRVGSRGHEMAKKRGMRTTRYITKEEAPIAMESFEKHTKKAKKSAFAASGVYGMMASGGVAHSIITKTKGGKVAAVFFGGLSGLAAMAGVGMGKEEKAARQEVKRMRAGKPSLQAKDYHTAKVKYLSELFRKHVRKTPQGYRR